MTNGTRIALAVFAVFTIIVVMLGGVALTSYIGAKNFGNQQEVALQAITSNNKNVLGQYTLKVQEVAQVPDMYKNDLKEIMTAEMQGRYGANGSQASMQWIKERSNNFDSSLYAKVQQIMEAGRNDFQTNQTRLIDQKRIYETALGSFWNGFWLGVAGYPKIDLASIKPVVAGDTEEIFQKGSQAPIKLR